MFHQGTPYIYVFLRLDLPHGQQIVQASHACIEASKVYLTDSQLEHPHLVVLAVHDESRLLKAANKLQKAGIRFQTFIEPDRDNEATAIATEPIFGEDRQFFKNYTLLSSSNHCVTQGESL